MKSFICNNISVNGAGHLCFAGQDTVSLAARYGTPLYLMDEDRIRYNCRVYSKAFREYFGEDSFPIFASKACCFKEMMRIVQDEGFGADVVSPGEIHTAAVAGFDLGRAFYHSNDKTDSDIRFAMEHGVGFFVIESLEEADAVNDAAAGFGIRQKVLLRLTPGIDTHTYVKINTGLVDSKFGVAIETGQADALLAHVLGLEHLDLQGFHCHVGSEVFAENVFECAARIMIDFMAEVRDRYGYAANLLNLGGGYGVRYTHSDPYLDIAWKIRNVADAVKESCKTHGLSVPGIIMEPGRSIVADAGMTLYTAGSVKNIPGFKRYISVDGGMTDNPRYSLYNARYSCIDASRASEDDSQIYDLVGRCCESGDIIQPEVPLPGTVCRGDIIAVCTTGAYNYSMASNYNRIPRPPVVMLKDGDSRVVVRRETLEDLTALDL